MAKINGGFRLARRRGYSPGEEVRTDDQRRSEQLRNQSFTSRKNREP
jgi:hypothetical protein